MYVSFRWMEWMTFTLNGFNGCNSLDGIGIVDYRLIRDLICRSWLKKALGYGRQKQVLWCTGWFDIEAVTFGRIKMGLSF